MAAGRRSQRGGQAYPAGQHAPLSARGSMAGSGWRSRWSLEPYPRPAPLSARASMVLAAATAAAAPLTPQRRSRVSAVGRALAAVDLCCDAAGSAGIKCPVHSAIF